MKTMHPLFVVVIVLAMGMSLWQAQQQFPSMIRWICIAGVVGMIVRVFAVASRKREERDGARAVDHDALRHKDLGQYLDWLKENVRGQDEAVTRVTRALQRGLELAGPGRSLGSFLLVGPTGTGKTFLSQMAAKALTPDTEPLLLRMNQYKAPADASALFGMPGGTVPGALTGPVLDEPHRVVILDEVDKCHPEIRHSLFDALDAGRCRDKASGRMVDFSGCVFFATSNAGADGLRGLGPDGSSVKARDVMAREAGFEKAFLARFTEILLLDALAPKAVAEIALLQLAKQWRGQGIELTFVDPALLAAAVARNGEYADYGVRQLGHCLRALTDGTLEDARRKGLRRARLAYSAADASAVLEGAS